MSFAPYIARDRTFQRFLFDFYIVNETGKQWYDGSPNQWMQEREWCVNRLREGMTVVDCGAHHGMMSLIFANVVGPSGKVFAYEALSSNARVIERNAALNGFRNIIVRPVGVGDSNSAMTAHYNSSNIVVVQNSAAAPGTEDAVVRMVRLEDDLPEETRVNLLKIDVEGHELNALRGMAKILLQRPAIDLELHNFIFADKISTLKQIVSILGPLNYTWELMGEIIDKPIDLGRTLDVERLVPFTNPHLLGVAD